EQHYAWIRMPNFRLSDLEATRLTAFLWSREGKPIELPENSKGDPTKGARLVVSSGCINCHTISDKNQTQLKAPALATIDKEHWAKGCLAPDPSGNAPVFALTEPQRQSIAAFAATD